MKDEDLRDLFAAFAMFACTGNGGDYASDARACYEAADAMIEEKYRVYPEDAPPEEVGIAAVVKRTRKKHG
jgi:hypothetical protein